MSRMLAIGAATSAVCLIAQVCPADTTKRKADRTINLDQKDIDALRSSATQSDKPQYYYYYNSPNGVQRYEYRPTSPADRSSPNNPPSQPARAIEQ